MAALTHERVRRMGHSQAKNPVVLVSINHPLSKACLVTLLAFHNTMENYGEPDSTQNIEVINTRYRPQTKLRKVMFSQACHSVHWGRGACVVGMCMHGSIGRVCACIWGGGVHRGACMHEDVHT